MTKEYAVLDKSFRKLFKENKELQAKHMKVCSEMKAFKNENEEIEKGNKALSVALKSSKKDLELNLKHSGKDIKSLREELATLKEYKIQHQEEQRKAKKLEKKLRQKEKRGREQSKAMVKIVNEPEVANIVKIRDSERLSTEEKSEAIEEESKDGENNKEPLEKHEEGTFETDQDDTEEVVEEKRDIDSNLSMTEPRPPDTSKHYDNISDMNAREFEHFLNGIVSNYISKSK